MTMKLFLLQVRVLATYLLLFSYPMSQSFGYIKMNKNLKMKNLKVKGFS